MEPGRIYQRHRYPAAIISHCVWLYYRFSLSYRDIELIMLKKGIFVTYESIRHWYFKFGKLYAKRIKKTKRYGDYVYMMKSFVKSMVNVFTCGVPLIKMDKLLMY